MPLLIVRNDITQMAVDAIVNPTNPRMIPGGGVDAAVHQAAGEALARECRSKGVLEPGKALLTRGYRLPCRYVIHTVGPQWSGGSQAEEEILRSSYREALALAKAHALDSIAFPLIGAGTLGIPGERVLTAAEDVIRGFLEDNSMTVYLVVYRRDHFCLSRERFADVQEFIDQHYVDIHTPAAPNAPRRRFAAMREKLSRPRPEIYEEASYCDEALPEPMESRSYSAPLMPSMSPSPMDASLAAAQLEKLMAVLDESFTQMLLRKIDEKGMTDAECYKKANIDRKLFSKIRNPKYKPGKPTAVALALALELDLQDTRELLSKAGYSLSHSNKFDVIIEFCILHGIYNIFDVNDILFHFDQAILGNVG